MEPHRLREWLVPSGRLFTCGRPGRSKHKDAKRVPDAVIRNWVENLPGPHPVIISLLGRKPDGTSEFSFYPFSGGFESPTAARRSFQGWLNEHYPEKEIEVRDYPTIDFEPVPQETLQAAAGQVQRLLAAGRVVVIMDSGGETRTGTLCRYMGITNSK